MDDLKDFLVLLSDGELKAKEYKLFRILDRIPSANALMESFTLVPIDVPVGMNSGIFILNLITGNAFANSKELDSKVNLLIKRSNLMMVKGARPNLWLAWADEFKDLPYCFKESRRFSAGLELIYKAFERLDSDMEALQQANLNESELKNRMTQSINKQVEEIKNVANNLMIERAEQRMPGMITNQQQRPPEPYGM